MSVSAMKKFENFSNWFDDLLLKARIVDNRFPVKGFLIYMEHGAYILDEIKKLLEAELEKAGHKKMYFPLVTSEELFGKEAEHIKGFSKEVFVINQGPGEQKLIVRPTSETIMYPMFKLWIRSHADLPLKVYQSVNVYRCETKATRALYRVREIPWNEAHTVHESPSEAEKQVKEAMEIYQSVLKSLGISYLILKRPDFDKFAGAVYSIAFDAWNPDGKVNQVATIHNLGRNFARAYEIEFEKKDGSRGTPHQTCYGFGFSRVLAAIIAQHGDDHGLVLPPTVAPTQIVIIPILFKGQEKQMHEYSVKIKDMLSPKWRVVLDDREDITPGEKFYQWELLGAPIRIEVGPREVVESSVTIARRDTLERITVRLNDLINEVARLMDAIASDLLEKSWKTLRALISDAKNVEEVKKVLRNRGIARVEWCGRIECAEKLKEEAKGEIRGERYDIAEAPVGNCAICGEKAKSVVYVARAY
ncbi:MAG: proline--tRNA ligase [Nitrososphaeria archaeon]|nr:proline--tRNA ligase [Aigarchaeota archaeon]MCX8187679.1 proline--tRNA ligase [Nitrososphaeria archaeon]MDW8021840.1 proline--tRNA ligase [Nitrososphaerota archaeon]